MTRRSNKSMWKEELDRILPLLGHRNWILVVDKAFPLQSAAGMTFLDTAEPILAVLKHTLKKIAEAPHLEPVVFLDQELEHMTNDLVMDVDVLRQEIHRTVLPVPERTVHAIPHEKIFAKLEAASKLFYVLVLKTESHVPYTSVFIQLNCGYWDEHREKNLRERMKRKKE